jgi:SsrA-binding protein
MDVKRGKEKKKQHAGLVAGNRRATYDYAILETCEAGLVLQGTEIKAIREGRVNLRESFARSLGNELWLFGMHIAPYSHGNVLNHDPIRPRKLLLHRKEIDKLKLLGRSKGLTMVPLGLYIKRGMAKVTIALAKGKRQYEKRRVIIQRDVEREIRREMKGR